MPYLVGMDEAGYGPNLGPLVISASVWWVADDAGSIDLYELLSEAVSRGPAAAALNGPNRSNGPVEPLAIADSKLLYRRGSGLRALERGVLASLELVDLRPRDWRSTWAALAHDSGAHRQSAPWFDGFDHPLPIACDAAELPCAAERVRAAGRRRCVRLVGLLSRAVFPDEFNVHSERFDSKGSALTGFTLELLAEALRPLTGSVRVVCDKHGGRNFYAAALQQNMGLDALVEVRGESAAESVYGWETPQSRVEARFRAGGEEFLPVALASMTSKYLRELALLAFNQFWCSRVPDLRPTAGYSVDARRFKADIAATQASLKIDDRHLWRNR